MRNPGAGRGDEFRFKPGQLTPVQAGERDGASMKKTWGLFAVIVIALSSGAASAGALELAAHRAFYALEIKDSRNSNFADVRGAVRVVRERSCEGWISEETVRMAVETDLGRVLEQGLHFTGWESFDGRHYRFASRARSNAEMLESRGSAQRGKSGDVGEVTYRLPSAQKQTLQRTKTNPPAHKNKPCRRTRSFRPTWSPGSSPRPKPARNACRPIPSTVPTRRGPN